MHQHLTLSNLIYCWSFTIAIMKTVEPIFSQLLAFSSTNYWTFICTVDNVFSNWLVQTNVHIRNLCNLYLLHCKVLGFFNYDPNYLDAETDLGWLSLPSFLPLIITQFFLCFWYDSYINLRPQFGHWTIALSR